ncbi:MAG: DUF6930 domain-containing protein [Nodosilinea sp.]
MTRLNRITIDRLKQIPRTATVWEGDRRPMHHLGEEDQVPWGRHGEDSDCIVWLDSGHGKVRGIGIVPASSGYEPVVRTLIQAIEAPQGALPPARPQKVVVCNRELQFYLRGALQDLDIVVDYEPDLPLIDDLFSALQQSRPLTEAQLPHRHAEAMLAKAMEIWELAPWHSLNEQQILAVELNHWDVDTLYVSVLGMGGVEYGLLMYRSLASLTQFRERVLLGEQSSKQMQEAFLEQDCLFLNFELFSDQEATLPSLQDRHWSKMVDAPDIVEPDFGSIHPLEGMRSQLAEQEGAILLVVLEAIKRFFSKYRSQLESPAYGNLKGTYQIANPEKSLGSSLKVTVKTLPELTHALTVQTDRAFADDFSPGSGLPALRDDYIPQGTLVMLVQFENSWLQQLRQNRAIAYQSQSKADYGQAITVPAIILQTSRPKAKTLVGQLQRAGGIQAICFNPGRDPIEKISFNLGLFQTGDGDMHLFAEYDVSQPEVKQLLESWEAWQRTSKGSCLVIVATGLTGQTRGKPDLKDMVAVFEAHCRTPQDLQLPPLLLGYDSNL